MRSIFAKQHTNTNQTNKTKKGLQFANMISQNDKNKLTGEKKIIHSQKSCNNYKSSLNNNDVGFADGKKNFIQKNYKGYLKSQEKVKRHQRSKTENLDTQGNQPSTIDLFTDMQSFRKFNHKKTDIKRQQSKKRIKAQSLKRLNIIPSNKGSSKDFKKCLNPQIRQKQSDPFPRQKREKGSKKQNTKAINQQKQRLFQTAKYDLQTLRGKLKKQKSDFEGESRKKCYTMKDQKDKCRTDNKNCSLLNLSQILHKSQYQDFLYLEQVKRNDLKSERSQTTKLDDRNNTDACRNLTRLVDHLTQTVSDEIYQTHYHKKFKNKQQKQHCNYQIGGRSFSFMNQAISQEIKHGKSNFSTGADSIAMDEQIHELIKLKLKAQQQVNHKISKQISYMKTTYLTENDNKMKRKGCNEQGLGDKSARTFRQCDNENKNEKIEKIMLLQIIQKYNAMTQKMLPFVFQPQPINPQQYLLQDVPQMSNIQNIESHKKLNQKYVQKYSQLAHKNTVYQEIINSLIRDGVNMEKYMISYFKAK